MRLVTVLFISFLLLNSVFAADNHIHRQVTLAGVPQGQGRYIRTDLYENQRFKSGYFFCAGANSTIFDMEYFFRKNYQPFQLEHLTRFSICQDQTLANCQEFATDKYQTLGNITKRKNANIEKIKVDLSSVAAYFQPCEPSSDLDEMVKKSIHLDDRHWVKMG